MRKYHLLSPVRRANPYRKIAKATHEHRIYSNKVNREFKRSKPNEVFLTDITYLKYGKIVRIAFFYSSHSYIFIYFFNNFMINITIKFSCK